MEIHVAELTQSDVQRVIDRIKKHGWTQYDFGRSEGPACLMGHISHALRNPVSKRSLVLGLGETVGSSVIHWNDTPGRTKQDILDILEKMKDQCQV